MYMVYLVYRQDTNGVNYLIEPGLSAEEAHAKIRSLTSGKPHKQEYFLVGYEKEFFAGICEELALQR